MPMQELETEIAAAVAFWGYETDVGVMGIQPVRDVDLIRHAYVLLAKQHEGIGSALLDFLRKLSTRRMLVGTWEAADWAIRFFICKHGLEQVARDLKTTLLKTYWTVPDRQIKTSVVLANPQLEPAAEGQ